MSDVVLADGVAIYRIAGHGGFITSVGMVTRAIEDAVHRGHDLCLIEALTVQGFDPPSVPARHQLIREWAKAADGRVHCAFVVRKDFIDHERFGVVAGRNFGLDSDVFHDEAEAMAWLLTLGHA